MKRYFKNLISYLCVLSLIFSFTSSYALANESDTDPLESIIITQEMLDRCINGPQLIAQDSFSINIPTQERTTITAYVNLRVMLMNSKTIGVDIWLSGSDASVKFNGCFGTAFGYINGNYEADENFKAKPLIGVGKLQASCLLNLPYDLSSGDTVKVIAKGEASTTKYGIIQFERSILETVK